MTVGRHSTAYKMAGLRLDPFYDTSTLSAGGGAPSTGLFAGASFGLSNLTNGFANRTVAYTSPSIGGARRTQRPTSTQIPITTTASGSATAITVLTRGSSTTTREPSAMWRTPELFKRLRARVTM